MFGCYKKSFLSILLLSAATLPILAFGSQRQPAQATNSQFEREGRAALIELGYDPDRFSGRQLAEAGILKKYQEAWNAYDPAVSDLTKLINPDQIVSFYADGADLLYRDMCVPRGLKSKTAFTSYLRILYKAYPKQVWGSGWKNIHLFVGAQPGEWSYYYNFEMYRAGEERLTSFLSGTGMERVQFNDDGKLLSDEVHLILNKGATQCKADSGN